MDVNKITDRIISDAVADAERIVEESRLRAAQLMEDGEKKTGEQVGKLRDDFDAQSKELLDRRMLNASLEGRKNTLAVRRRLVDKVFSDALDYIFSLTDSEYFEILKQLIVKGSDIGEKKLFSSDGDDKLLKTKASIERINKSIKECGKSATVVYAGKTDRINSGCILVGETTDVECSVEAAIDLIRESGEEVVAKILFESGV
ncbi:MAG: hypothetical protein GX222_00370 [Ruminococcaceae bacterium]|nr:hypothetical protein [Oscillospiraceae bacterium]